MTSKPWWQSRTLWLNAVAAALATAEASLNLIQPQVRPQVYLLFLVVLAATNAALRFLTTQPITTGEST